MDFTQISVTMTSKTGASVDAETAGNSGDAAIPTTESAQSELADLSDKALKSLSDKFGIPVFAAVAIAIVALLVLLRCCICIGLCICKMCCCKKEKGKKVLKGAVDLKSVSMLGNSLEEQEAQAYADDDKSLLLMETSAKTAMNVNDSFLAIAKKLPKNEPDQLFHSQFINN